MASVGVGHIEVPVTSDVLLVDRRAALRFGDKLEPPPPHGFLAFWSFFQTPARARARAQSEDPSPHSRRGGDRASASDMSTPIVASPVPCSFVPLLSLLRFTAPAQGARCRFMIKARLGVILPLRGFSDSVHHPISLYLRFIALCGLRTAS